MALTCGDSAPYLASSRFCSSSRPSRTESAIVAICWIPAFRMSSAVAATAGNVEATVSCVEVVGIDTLLGFKYTVVLFQEPVYRTGQRLANIRAYKIDD